MRVPPDEVVQSPVTDAKTPDISCLGTLLVQFVDRTTESVCNGPATAFNVNGHIATVLILSKGRLDVSLVDLLAAAGGFIGCSPNCHGRLLTHLSDGPRLTRRTIMRQGSSKSGVKIVNPRVP